MSEAVADKVETKFHVFKHVSASAQYIFQHQELLARSAAFVNHIYYTDDEREIRELQQVCRDMQEAAKRGGTAYIYVDPNFAMATKEDLDPNAELRRKIRMEERAKLLEEIKAEQMKLRDGGQYSTPQNIIPSRLPHAQGAVLSSSGVPQTPVVKMPVPAAHDIAPAK